MPRTLGSVYEEGPGRRQSPAATRSPSPLSWAQSALMLQRTAGNRATAELLSARPAEGGVLVGRPVPSNQRGGVWQGSAGALPPTPVVQRKACNFYVYDSTEDTKVGTAWKLGAATWALGARGGHAIASSNTIEYMLKRIVDKVAEDGCDCVEEIQFWSHGSAGNAMYISKTGDEITAADFGIPGLDKFGYIPSLTDMAVDPKRYEKWKAWFAALTWRQQLLVELRSYICEHGAEIYYRSCGAFQGRKGQEFARESAAFWRSKVIGHTKIIGLTQPGRKELKPGEVPQWSESEGATTEMKKRDTKPKKF